MGRWPFVCLILAVGAWANVRANVVCPAMIPMVYPDARIGDSQNNTVHEDEALLAVVISRLCHRVIYVGPARGVPFISVNNRVIFIVNQSCLSLCQRYLHYHNDLRVRKKFAAGRFFPGERFNCAVRPLGLRPVSSAVRVYPRRRRKEKGLLNKLKLMGFCDVVRLVR